MEVAVWRSLPADQLSRRISQHTAVIAKDTSRSRSNALQSASHLLSGLYAYGQRYDLPSDAAADLFATLTCSERVPPALRLLCAAILIHTTPNRLPMPRMDGVDRAAVHLVLPILQAQYHRQELFLQHIPSVITYIYDNDRVSRATLAFLSAVATYHVRALEASHVDQVTELVLQSLSHTSSRPPEKERGMFGQQREPYVEMDGAEVTGTFTPLCFGKVYGGDHLMSMACFSILHTWLRHVYATESAVNNARRNLSTDSPVLTEDFLRENFDAPVDTSESIRRSFPIEQLGDGAEDAAATTTTPGINANTRHGDGGDATRSASVASLQGSDNQESPQARSESPEPGQSHLHRLHADDRHSSGGGRGGKERDGQKQQGVDGDDAPSGGSVSGKSGEGVEEAEEEAAALDTREALDISVFAARSRPPREPGMGLQLRAPILHAGIGADMPEFLLSEEMKDDAFAYCVRVMDQCCLDVAQDRWAGFVQAGDIALRHAVAKQAVDTMWALARLHPGIVPAAKVYLDRLLARFQNIPEKALHEPHLLLSLVRFFVTFGELIAFDLHTLFNTFFDRVLASRFTDQLLCLDIVSMMTECKDALVGTHLFPTHFPNILRILAWHPKAFVDQFVTLVPLMCNPLTFSELLHLVFDLPCLSAALVQLKRAGSEDALVAQATKTDPNAGALYTFILRTKGGICETIDKLPSLHQLTAADKDHPIVLACAEVAPLFARIILDTVLRHASEADVKALIPVLLERVVALFPIEAFQQEMRSLMAEYVLKVFQRHPGLIVDLKTDILEFVRNRNNAASGGEEFYVHLVWIIGEYASPVSDPRCTTDLMVVYHEELEAFVGEVNSMLQHGTATVNPAYKVVHTTRLMNILMMALAKLATRCPEVLARVSLFLNKTARSHMESKVIAKSSRKAVLQRAMLLLQVLKQPAVAAAVLSEPPPIIAEATARTRASGPSGTLAILSTCQAFSAQRS